MNLKTFISELDIPVVAGEVLDHRTALHLMRTGAAGVIVGYGSTAGVTTSAEVLGISVPMATAIADAALAAARREYLDETGGRYVHVLADGDIHLRGPGQSDRLRCGRRRPGHSVGGGRRRSRVRAGSGRPRRPTRRCRAVRCCRCPTRSGRRWRRCSTGRPTTPSGSLNLVGGLRRAMAKAGYCDLKEFQKVGLTVGA